MDIAKNHQIPSDKKFATFFTLLNFLIGVYLSTIEVNQWAFVFYFLSLLFFSANIFKLKFLHTLNIAWYRFGILLGLIVSPIVNCCQFRSTT